jgi:hypothetical protein
VARLLKQADKPMAKITLSLDDEDTCHIQPTTYTAGPFQDFDRRWWLLSFPDTGSDANAESILCAIRPSRSGYPHRPTAARHSRDRERAVRSAINRTSTPRCLGADQRLNDPRAGRWP